MKSTIISILLTVTLFMTGTSAFAATNEPLDGTTENEQVFKVESIVSNLEQSRDDDVERFGETKNEMVYTIGDEMFSASVKQEIVGDGIAIGLYTTFDRPDAALEQVSKQCKEILNLLQKTYRLQEFDEVTWRDYYEYLSVAYDDEMICKQIFEDDSLATLEMFFDIYENDSINKELISLALDAEGCNDLLANGEFYCNLPYYVTSEIDNSKQINVDILPKYDMTESTKGYTISKAVSYANSYAMTYNSAFPQLKKDCTNFTSQVLYKGGKGQTATWYCFKEGGKWYYTKRWTTANNFANFCGVDTTTSSHKTFASKLKKGDFIVEDKANDGSWDHAAFVTAVASSYSATLGYKNYKVAQHTKNYLAWASSTTCGWDALKTDYPNCKFGIIRI